MQQQNYPKTPDFVLKFKNDKRNEDNPYKVISSTGPAQRFATRDAAMSFFYQCKGRCLVSHNSSTRQKYIAYKFK